MSHNPKERKSHHYSDFWPKKFQTEKERRMRVARRSHTTRSFFLLLRLFHVTLRSPGLKAVQVETRQTDTYAHHFFFFFRLALPCSFDLFQLHFSSDSSAHVTFKSFFFLYLEIFFFPLLKMCPWLRIKRGFNMPNVLLLLLFRFRCILHIYSTYPHWAGLFGRWQLAET